MRPVLALDLNERGEVLRIDAVDLRIGQDLDPFSEPEHSGVLESSGGELIDAAVPVHERDREDVLRAHLSLERADRSLYEAKTLGRNRVVAAGARPAATLSSVA